MIHKHCGLPLAASPLGAGYLALELVALPLPLLLCRRLRADSCLPLLL